MNSKIQNKEDKNNEYNNEVKNNVKNYYSDVLQKSTDLKTNACCTFDKIPKNIKKLLDNVHSDIKNSYYGCGLVIPDCLKDCNVLDLGCGTGMDVFTLSQLVGENGFITGVDMTQKQLNIANKWKEWHIKKFNFSKNNIQFKLGCIEYLDVLNIVNNSMDVIVSNCVVNLSPNKKKVLEEIYRILKVGGEFYFSDVYCSQRIPNHLKKDQTLWGECLSGALYWNDFIHLAKTCGFKDIRLVKSNKISINNSDVSEKIGHIDFYSATYRLFKLPDLLEQDCEDYGQAVIYKGTIENHPEFWELDSHHKMIKNKVFNVCGNTWNMLYHSRFKQHFDFIGNFDTHYGIFAGCGKNIPFEKMNNSNLTNNCC